MRLFSFSVYKCVGAKFVKHQSAKRFYGNSVASLNSIAERAAVDVRGWQTEHHVRERVLADVLVSAEFVSAEEEHSLMAEVETYLKKMRYEFDHWDNAIHGYRESERAEWQPCNRPVVQRLHALAVRHAANNNGAGAQTLPHLHVLDLHENGNIKPHMDSTRFCGDVIVGLCLLSPAVMRIALAEQPALHVDVLLPARGVYVLKGDARYMCTHAVLGGEESVWNGEKLLRRRRVSIMCRTKPS